MQPPTSIFIVRARCQLLFCLFVLFGLDVCAVSLCVCRCLQHSGLCHLDRRFCAPCSQCQEVSAGRQSHRSAKPEASVPAGRHPFFVGSSRLANGKQCEYCMLFGFSVVLSVFIPSCLLVRVPFTVLSVSVVMVRAWLAVVAASCGFM